MKLDSIKTQETAKNVSVYVDDATVPNKPNIHITGYIDTYSGYGEHCRAVLNGLNSIGKYNIKLSALQCAKNVSPQITEKYRNNIYFDKFNCEDSIHLSITAPGYLQKKLVPDCKKSFAWTMTETNQVPPAIAELTHNVDTIICPTYIDKNKFREAGVSNTVVCPLGYDENLYHAETPKLDIVNLRERYVFGCVGSWNARKNQRSVIRSFIKSFRSSDNVTLLIVAKYAVRKDSCLFSSLEEELNSYIQESARRYNVSDKELPHISYYTGTMHESIMPMMMSRIDCLVGASLGESTWLPGLHMAAIGKPIIQSENPNAGYMEYLHKNPYMVRGTNHKTTHDMYEGISEFYENCSVHYADIDELSDMMLRVYKEDNTSAQTLAIQSVRSEVSYRTWKDSILKLIDILF